MQCSNPLMLPDRQGRPDQPRGLVVPCGKCLACKINRSRQWALRLTHELQYWDSAVFVTLTYDEENCPWKFVVTHNGGFDNIVEEVASISKRELQKFFKRLRKTLQPRRIKYYACGEYGDTNGRPHYHAIIFGVSLQETEVLERLWNRGLVHCGTVTFDSARYVAGYLDKKYYGPLACKMYTSRGLTIPFQLSSQGLGLKFALDNKKQIEDHLYTTIKGAKQTLPKYYKTKLEINPDLLSAYAEDKQIQEMLHLLNKGIPLADHNKILTEENEQREATLKSKVAIYNNRKGH
nr:MAG: replication initiator protein [Microviridae sp.]